MKWISVKERLPQKKIPLILFDINDMGVDFGYYTKDGWISHLNKITHWIKLPDPPKKLVLVKRIKVKDINYDEIPKISNKINTKLKLKNFV